MAYPNRIVVYLKAPAKRQAAQINVLPFNDPTTKAKEKDFTDSSKPKEISRRQSVAFTISADTTSDVLLVSGLSVNWEGGCRLVPLCLLGEKGDALARTGGVRYENTNEFPVRALHCTFRGTGLLTCTDGRGVTIAMDLTKPGSGALCLTVLAKAGKRGRVVFRKKFLPSYKITGNKEGFSLFSMGK